MVDGGGWWLMVVDVGYIESMCICVCVYAYMYIYTCIHVVTMLNHQFFRQDVVIVNK